MTKKTKGAAIMIGSNSAQEAKAHSFLMRIILASVQAVSPLRGSQRAIMSNACSIAGGDLGGSFSRRTIATPFRGVSLFYGGCSYIMALLRPRSVWAPPDGNPLGLMFPVDIPPTRQAVLSILADGLSTNQSKTTGV